MDTTRYRTTRYTAPAYRAYARTRDQRPGYLRLMLVSVTTAGLVGLGVGVASLDRPLVGKPCSVPNVTTHDATSLTLSCDPASPEYREAVWQYVHRSLDSASGAAGFGPAARRLEMRFGRSERAPPLVAHAPVSRTSEMAGYESGGLTGHSGPLIRQICRREQLVVRWAAPTVRPECIPDHRARTSQWPWPRTTD